MLVSNVQYRLLFLIYNVVKIFENNFKTGYIVHFVAKFKKKAYSFWESNAMVSLKMA